MTPEQNAVIWLVAGMVYIVLGIFLQEHLCEKYMAIYGYTIGGFYILMALTSFYRVSNGLLLYIITFVKHIINIVGLYLLYSDEGVACRYENKSKIWLAYTILYILVAPLEFSGSV